MKELKIYEFQAKRIEDTLRLVANTLHSHGKTTCLDRDVMQSWEMIINVLAEHPEKTTDRFSQFQPVKADIGKCYGPDCEGCRLLNSDTCGKPKQAETAAKELSERIDEWHNSKSDLPLHEYLGMTFQEYSNWVTGKTTAKDELSPRVAKLILEIRDCFVKDDMEEVWHLLYQIASPECLLINPWTEIERIAAEQPKAPQTEKIK
jgi:hypothetical protein